MCCYYYDKAIFSMHQDGLESGHGVAGLAGLPSLGLKAHPDELRNIRRVLDYRQSGHENIFFGRIGIPVVKVPFCQGF